MKKILTFSLLALGLSLLPAKGELLYFMVNSFDWEGPKYNFDYALVGVAKSDGDGGWTTTWEGQATPAYLQVKTSQSGTAGDYVDSTPSGVYTVAGPAWAELGDYASDEYAFYIETWKTGLDGNDVKIWGFDPDDAGDGNVPTAYTTLVKEGHVYTDSTAAQDVTPWLVPEPTSGLLMLLGLAGLALKRKKVGRESRSTVELSTDSQRTI